MAGTTVKNCKCINEFQDSLYGKGMRLMNVREDAKGGKCTVCGDKKVFTVSK